MKISISNSTTTSTTIKDKIQNVLDEYVDAKNSSKFSGSNEIAQLFNNLKENFSNTPSVLDRDHIKVKVSYGQGNWASVPWIAFLDDRETSSTQRGVYCVILFRKDMSGFYITYNQGVTDILKDNGKSKGYEVLRSKADILRQHCVHLSSLDFSLDNNINCCT